MSTKLEELIKLNFYITYVEKCQLAGVIPESLDILTDAVKIAAYNVGKMVEEVGMEAQPHIAVRIDDTFSCIIQANPRDNTGNFGIIETAMLTKIIELEKEGDTNVGIHEDQTEHDE